MNHSQVFYLRLAGIGGQGVVHLATTIASAAVKAGVPVSVIDRPRSAMRLGPITCDVCFGQEEFAPFIVPGEADAVLGMEPLDGVMNAAYLLKPNGILVLQVQPTHTIEDVLSGTEDARRIQWKEQIEARGGCVVTAEPSDVTGICRNYYMLGVLMKVCPEIPVSEEDILHVLNGQEDNIAAFRQGMSALN